MPAREAEYRVRADFVNPSGARADTGLAFAPQKAVVFDNDPSIPTGITIVFQMAVKPTGLGVCFIEISVDGRLELRLPFTLKRVPAAQQAK